MLLENLKWPDVKSLDFSQSPVLIPLGSLEQHGPHLPLTTDTEIVTAIAREVESSLADRILVTPTLWLCPSPLHINFPRTLIPQPPIYICILKSLTPSLLPHAPKNQFPL